MRRGSSASAVQVLDAGLHKDNTFSPKDVEKEFLSKGPFNRSVYEQNEVDQHVLKVSPDTASEIAFIAVALVAFPTSFCLHAHLS